MSLLRRVALESQQQDESYLDNAIAAGGVDNDYLNGIEVNTQSDEPSYLALEIGDMDTQIGQGEQAIEHMAEAVLSVRSAGDVGLRAVECEAVMKIANIIYRRFGIEKRSLSFENLKEKRPTNAAKLAKEGIWTAVKDILHAIAQALRGLASWVGDFFGALFNKHGGGGGGGSSSPGQLKAELVEIKEREQAAPPDVRRIANTLQHSQSAEQAAHEVVQVVVKEAKKNKENIDPEAQIRLAKQIKEKLEKQLEPLLLRNHPFLSLHGKDFGGGNGAVQRHKQKLRELEGMLSDMQKATSKELVDHIEKAFLAALDGMEVEEDRAIELDNHLPNFIDLLECDKPVEHISNKDNEVEIVQFQPRLPGDYNLQITRPMDFRNPEKLLEHIFHVDRRIVPTAQAVAVSEDEPVSFIQDIQGLVGLMGEVEDIRKKYLSHKLDHFEKTCQLLADKADAIAKKATEENVSAEIGHAARGLVAAIRQCILMFAISGYAYADKALTGLKNYYLVCGLRHDKIIKELTKAIDSKNMKQYLADMG